MIIIFSTSNDRSIVNIVEYLNKYKQKFHVINLGELKSTNFQIIFEKNQLVIKVVLVSGEILDFDSIKCFFFRSSKIKKGQINIDSLIGFDNDIAKTYFDLDEHTLIDFIYSKIMEKSLGWLNQTPINKLIQIDLAQKCGLKIPDTFICNSKRELQIITKKEFLLTKAIQENIAFQDLNKICFQRVSKVEVKDLPDFFLTSLFQENIEKDLEIRTFFLENSFYSIAVCNVKNTIDMRDNYSTHQYYKCKLPIEIEHNLNKLMKLLGLISGSIDLILSNNKDYYFLEVNPEGQYDWVSVFGGYNLDEKIAKYMINYEGVSY